MNFAVFNYNRDLKVTFSMSQNVLNRTFYLTQNLQKK